MTSILFRFKCECLLHNNVIRFSFWTNVLLDDKSERVVSFFCFIFVLNPTVNKLSQGNILSDWVKSVGNFSSFYGYLSKEKSKYARMRSLRTRQTPPSLRMPPALKYGGGKVCKPVPKKVKRASTIPMAAKPLRMREWLEQLMDNDECKGLAWVSKEEKTFEIRWCHASRHDFDTKEHADLFIKYAQFTGRSDIADGSQGYNSKLKSNFRSALHSLVDCIPIKEEWNGRSKGENAVKVYQFIDSSHPEYIRKKMEKTKNQRNSKRNAASKSKSNKTDNATKEESKQELHEDLVSHSHLPSSTTAIILPDEAEDFLATAAIDQSEPDTFSSSMPMISHIPSTISSTTPSELQFNPVVDHNQQQFATVSSLGASADNNDNNNTAPVVNFGLDTSSAEEKLQLPRFSVLGVDDRFDTPISHSCQRLNSGGSMRVRIEKPKHETQTLPFLTEFKLPSLCTQSTPVQPQHRGRYNVFRAVEEDTLFPGSNTVDTQIESNHFQEETFQIDYNSGNASFGPGAYGQIIQQNHAVTVVRQDPETVSQGENYDLDIGSMQYTATHRVL